MQVGGKHNLLILAWEEQSNGDAQHFGNATQGIRGQREGRFSCLMEITLWEASPNYTKFLFFSPKVSRKRTLFPPPLSTHLFSSYLAVFCPLTGWLETASQ